MDCCRCALGAFLFLFSNLAAAGELPLVTLDAPGLRRVCDAARPDGQVHFSGNEVERGKARLEHRKRRAAALGRFYVVTVPAAGFAFREYDYAGQRLPLEVRKPLVVGDGAEVYIPPAEEDPELVMRLPPPRAETIVRLRAKGALDLRLAFNLDPGEGGDPCIRSPSRRNVKVRVEPLAFELIERGKTPRVRYRGELAAYREALRTVMPVTGPRVQVARPSVTSGEAPRELVAALRGLEAGLLPCYRQGLAGNARLRGALVVGFNLDDAGRVTAARSEINSLGDSSVVSCVVGKLRAQRFPRPLKGQAHVSVPIYFSAAGE